MASSNDQFIGRDVLDGQFKILQKIGSGGMGSVYKASQTAMNRLVAVKILHPKLANRKDLVSRFSREASAMSHLVHPNTVRVYMFGELEDGSLFIAMEFLEGKNLHQTVKKGGPMEYIRALPMLIQVCGALEEAHQKGIIHRDLKPENIFLCNYLGKEDYPKVLDFGLAKVTEREMRPGSIVLTQEGMVFGTPEFMSPEQAQGKILDASSDIYSLAVILYEALTGKLPFDAKTPMEYIQHHVITPPIDLNQRIPDKQFPPELARVIAKALAKKPEDRFRSAADFGEALHRIVPDVSLPDAFLGRPGPSLSPPKGSSLAPFPPVPSAPAMVSSGDRAASKGPSLGLILGVAVASLIIGVLIAVIVMKSLASRSPAPGPAPTGQATTQPK